MTEWPENYGRVVCEEVGSTLDAAIAYSIDNAPPFWLLAHHQTAARGRRGRPWSMPKGNFAATLVLDLNERPANIALRSFVMSLALYRTFVEVTGQERAFALKWPNDVLLNGGKVAGILLENGGGGGQSGLLAIGVGVNLRAAPDPSQIEKGAVRPVSLRGETSVAVSPEPFLNVLARQYAQLEHQFQEIGFAPIRLGWLTHAARLDKVITARTSREIVTGIFEDVDAEGHLVLRGPQGPKTIAAADVYF